MDGVEYGYYNVAVVDEQVTLTFVVVEKNIIRSIVFEGNRKYKNKTLLKKVGFKVGDSFDAVTVEYSREALVEFYRKKGYALIKVSVDKGKLGEGKLVYRIKEGSRVRIKSVKFVGNEALKTG